MDIFDFVPIVSLYVTSCFCRGTASQNCGRSLQFSWLY